jgi:hypothetical protein
MIQTGWLTADHHLRAAASVWSWVLTAFVPDDETGPASVESLSASALFRLSSGNTHRHRAPSPDGMWVTW